MCFMLTERKLESDDGEVRWVGEWKKPQHDEKNHGEQTQCYLIMTLVQGILSQDKDCDVQDQDRDVQHQASDIQHQDSDVQH